MKRLIMTIFVLITSNSIFAPSPVEEELFKATQAKDVAKVQELLNKKVNVNFTLDNTSPLDAAAYSGYDQIAKLLIENGADVNWKSNFGQAPLHLAAYMGNKNIVKLLLENGANPNILDKNGATPLLSAVDSEAPYKIDNEVVFDIANLLLKHGADFTIEDKDTRSPIRVAEGGKYKDRDDVLRLFKNSEEVLTSRRRKPIKRS